MEKDLQGFISTATTLQAEIVKCARNMAEDRGTNLGKNMKEKKLKKKKYAIQKRRC